MRKEADRAAYLGALFARSCPEQEPHLVARHVTDLRRAAKSLDSLAVADCNYGLSQLQEKRRENLTKQVKELASFYGLRAHTSGDPRGAVVKLFDPSDEDKGDGFGGGWPVY